jgi:hypothetical protein
MYKLWVNEDIDGNIIAAFGGYEKYIVEPVEPYDYYFYVSADVYKQIDSYKVINGELVLK